MLRIFLVWLSIIPLAIANGAFRQEVLIPLLGEAIAQPISGTLLIIIIFIVAYIFLKVKDFSNKKCLFIGLIWVILTICFETIFGLAIGISLEELINNYDITTGNLWLVVVLFTGITPLLVKITKNKKNKN